MKIEPSFIGLQWIGMVEKLMGEVARRSYKDGSRAQLTLVIRDKGDTKPSFEKLRENLSFSLLTKGTTSLLTMTERFWAEPFLS